MLARLLDINRLDENQLVRHQRNQCPHCQGTHLQRIGVSGIKKCADCGAFVDVRQKSWLKRLISAS